MTTTTPAPAPVDETPRSGRIRVLWASLVGTSLESYDFYVFSYLSAFFIGPLFFEPLGPFGATLASFLTIALAFVVRPIGAIIFGHVGDRWGRRKTLIFTITLMGVATGAIGLLPTYAVAGWLGAVLLVLLRVIQGLSLAGEWGGAVLHRHRARWPEAPRLLRGNPPARFADRLDPHGVRLPDSALPAFDGRLPHLGLAYPVPPRLPAAARLALPPLVDR